MQKKILIGVLGALWITIGIIAGFCITEFNEYQMAMEISPEIEKLIMDIIYYLLVFAFILSCVIFMIINQAFKQMGTVITKLTNEAKSLDTNGDGHVIRYYSVSEFDELINAFDGMKEHYHRTTRTLQYQKSKAESIVTNLQEGIIIIDKEGYITEENSYAVKYLEELKDLSPNSSINYVLRELPAVQMIENALHKQKYSSCEIMKNDKILHLRIHPIARRQKYYGYMITIIDITRTRQLEEIRYQFVSNVTHELKTPLTSIQGFVETLKEGAIEEPRVAMRFLDIIDVEAKRLYRLIQDILLLSEIENMGQLVEEPIEINDIAAEVEQMIVQEATSKGVELYVEVEGQVGVKVSRDHMKQVIMNLVSNAVRYTDEGSVRLKVRDLGTEVYLEVRDTGIGIPEESLERVFERFYRVDKSRSRKSGGTGLGLSITKHIVQLYNGSIQVESKVGEGTCFKIYFQK